MKYSLENEIAPSVIWLVTIGVAVMVAGLMMAGY